MKNEQKLIDDVLGEDFMQQALQELGLQNLSRDDQEEFIAKLGENILKRVSLEILSVLPEGERDTFVSLFGSGDGAAMNQFLAKHIDDPVKFVREYAVQEYEATKSGLNQMRQGVE